MQAEYKLSDEQLPLASNDMLCLHLRFDDVWFRALYKCDHLVTFSLRGSQGGVLYEEHEAWCKRMTGLPGRCFTPWNRLVTIDLVDVHSL